MAKAKTDEKRPILCEKQSSYIKGCMEKKARFKRVVAGNGGSTNGTVLETYHCKVKICQQIEKVVKILSLSLLSLFKKGVHSRPDI